MIYKELDPFQGRDKFEVAGRKAEEQMAFYLRRFFAKSDDVDVLNYLRIELGGEVAQMDHLVLHPYGLLIVESKSVSGSVQIKNDGQWIRWFGKQPSGMRSPITQAKMQAMLLRDLLNDKVKQKSFFDNVRLDVLVAISDTGTIQWPASGALPEVCKADQVHERILGRVDQFRRLRREADILAPRHRQVIADFLCKVHRPFVTTPHVAEPSAPYAAVTPAVTPTHAKVAEPMPTPSAPMGPSEKAGSLPDKACKHCRSSDLEVRYGQYGYYFYCRSCQKNTAIRFACPACGSEGRIRKAGKEFFAECKACDASALYHSN